MSLPPLTFKDGAVWNTAHTAYAITEHPHWTNAAKQRTGWPTGLFECMSMEDVGINCCCAHGCCSPCTYASALGALGIQEAQFAAYSSIIAGLMPKNDRVGDALGTIAALGAGFTGGAARTKLYDLLYGQTGHGPGAWNNACLHIFCAPCAYCQESNAVIVYAREHLGTPMTYGAVTNCKCCYVVDAANPARRITSLPPPQTMERV